MRTHTAAAERDGVPRRSQPPRAWPSQADPRRPFDWHMAAVAVAIAGQVFAGIWFASGLNSKVDEIGSMLKAGGGLEHRLSAIETELKLGRPSRSGGAP